MSEPTGTTPERTCRKCGCTDSKACIEFDERGRGMACCWVAEDVCSGCSDVHPAPTIRRPVLAVAPSLAGYVARRRR